MSHTSDYLTSSCKDECIKQCSQQEVCQRMSTREDVLPMYVHPRTCFARSAPHGVMNSALEKMFCQYKSIRRGTVLQMSWWPVQLGKRHPNTIHPQKGFCQACPKCSKGLCIWEEVLPMQVHPTAVYAIEGCGQLGLAMNWYPPYPTLLYPPLPYPTLPYTTLLYSTLLAPPREDFYDCPLGTEMRDCRYNNWGLNGFLPQDSPNEVVSTP